MSLRLCFRFVCCGERVLGETIIGGGGRHIELMIGPLWQCSIDHSDCRRSEGGAAFGREAVAGDLLDEAVDGGGVVAAGGEGIAEEGGDGIFEGEVVGGGGAQRFRQVLRTGAYDIERDAVGREEGAKNP